MSEPITRVDLEAGLDDDQIETLGELLRRAIRAIAENPNFGAVYGPEHRGVGVRVVEDLDVLAGEAER